MQDRVRRWHVGERHRALALIVALALGASLIATAVSGGTERDLGGIWRVRIDARTGGGMLCGLVPALVESYVDTVASARTLAELVTAVIPDSLRTTFAWYCTVAPVAGDSETAVVHCDLPLILVAPCSLRVEFELVSVLVAADSVSGRGAASATLHGPGFCPRSSCPGTVTVSMERIGDVER